MLSQLSPTKNQWLGLFFFLLIGPALLVNIGALAFIDDESIRALVALEMVYSGNFITPTLLGEYYYNKPPLYNWLLIPFFKLMGYFGETPARLATVFFLLCYVVTIYLFTSRYFNRKVGVLAALMYLTCGRVLFWDSFLGLIDTCFSWLTFTLFMVIFEFFRREKYLLLFTCAYGLSALTFLMKGLPAIVFLGASLLTAAIFFRKFRVLFSWQHLLGGLLFVILVGSYYWAYQQHNDLSTIFATLFNESAKRTVVQYGWTDTLIHFFTFPFSLIYHFLPWTLFGLFFFFKDIRKAIWGNAVIQYCMWIFLINILPYWSSVEVYPRYLLMLMPLIFIAFAKIGIDYFDKNCWPTKFLLGLMWAFSIISLCGSLLPLFLQDRLNYVPFLALKSMVIFSLLSVFVALFAYWKHHRLLVFVLVLLTFRLGFNWFVLPDRNAHDFGGLCRDDSKRIGLEYKDEPLFVHEHGALIFFNAFYISATRGEVIKRVPESDIPSEATFLILRHHLDEKRMVEIDSMRTRHAVYSVARFR